MKKGLPFLVTAHDRLKEWQKDQWQHIAHSLTPSQFSQITGLDAQIVWDAIVFQASSAMAHANPLSNHQTAAESAQP